MTEKEDEFMPTRQSLLGRALLHRDIKLANISFAHGGWELADIGLVTDIGQDSIQSTLAFMPLDGRVRPQADLYSLGKMLYEISTGKSAFDDFPVLPSGLSAFVNDPRLLQLNRVILKACANAPARRIGAFTSDGQSNLRSGNGVWLKSRISWG